ncbi:MAG: hypothetical protein GC191_16025 [Azospirillum sp.]|nr:hypothetical protein [Azospirillum sp.]
MPSLYANAIAGFQGRNQGGRLQSTRLIIEFPALPEVVRVEAQLAKHLPGVIFSVERLFGSTEPPLGQFFVVTIPGLPIGALTGSPFELAQDLADGLSLISADPLVEDGQARPHRPVTDVDGDEEPGGDWPGPGANSLEGAAAGPAVRAMPARSRPIPNGILRP